MNTEAEPQTKLTLIRGNEFPGGAINTEIIQATEAVNTMDIGNIFNLFRSRVVSLFHKIWPEDQIQLAILESLKTEAWALSFSDSIKHGFLTRSGLKISIAPTSLAWMSYKGWYIYNISVDSVDIRIKNEKIIIHIVDNILPSDKLLWGMPNKEVALAAVRKTLANK